MALKILNNKKAIFFTLSALALILIIVFSSGLTQKYDRREKSFIIETRIDSMASFIYSIEEDIERGMYISAYRSLLALEDYISNQGDYIDDTETRFIEAFINGTVNSSLSAVMINNTFINWTSKMKEQAIKTDILINFTIDDLKVYQKDPWTVSVDLNTTIQVSDKKGTASWKKDKFVTSDISILSFEDPAYTIESGGDMFVTINTTPYENDYVDGSDVSNLQTHLENSYYSAFTSAPNFLMRFEGNFSADPEGNGIESLVDKAELSLYITIYESRSSVDYLYWSGQSTTDYQIQGMPSNFRMDDESNAEINETHLEKYQVQDLIV